MGENRNKCGFGSLLSFNKKNVNNNNVIKFKGSQYYRRVSVLCKKDLNDEIKIINKLKKNNKGLTYCVPS